MRGWVQWGPPPHVLAPIFDLINHRPSCTKGDGSTNTHFGIKNKRTYDTQDTKLVVRAVRNIAKREYVLIDYGDSARPAWRCLTSYEYNVDLEVEDDEQNVKSVTELWMNGLRFEVDPHSVSYDLVEVAAPRLC